MSTILFSSLFIIIDSMQKVVSNVINIFTSEDMENTPLVIF